MNRSGNIANVPRPEARNPNSKCINGLAVRAYKSRISEKMISPIVNSECNFLYMSMYVTNRKISSVAFIVED